MKIVIRPNVELAEIPSSLDLPDGACLRNALLLATPQVINKETGEYVDDPDIWDIRLNDVRLFYLNDGLDTKMHDGDVITMEIVYHLS